MPVLYPSSFKLYNLLRVPASDPLEAEPEVAEPGSRSGSRHGRTRSGSLDSTDVSRIQAAAHFAHGLINCRRLKMVHNPCPICLAPIAAIAKVTREPASEHVVLGSRFRWFIGIRIIPSTY